MGSERVLMLKLLGDTGSMDKSLRRTEGRIKSFGRGVAKWGTAIVADLAITGVEKLTDALGDAWTGFREGEQAAGQLGTTWKNLGLDGSKLGGTIEDISAAAKRLGIDDTESIMAFNKALQNTGGKPKQAMDRLRIAQDLVANGSAPNLSSAMKLIAQAGKGSARVVDAFGLKSKTAGGRIKELGEKVKGAAKNKAKLDPLGTLFNAINEDLEGIVGSLAGGDIEGALGSIAQIGADISATWSKLYAPVSAVLDKLLGGERYGPGGEKIGSTFGDISASIGGFLDKISQAADTILPRVQEGFTNLGELWDALQPHAQNAVDAIQPLIDIASNAGAGTLGFVLDSVNGALDAIAKLLSGDFSGAFDAVTGTVGKLGEDLNTMFSGLPAKITDEWLPDIRDAALGVGQEILGKIIDNAGLAPQYLVNILTGESGIVGKLGGAVESIARTAGDIGKGIVDGIVGWVSGLPATLGSIIASAVNTIIDAWNSLDFSIPAFTLDLPGVSIPNPMHGTVLDPFGTPNVQLLGETHASVFSGTKDLIPDLAHVGLPGSGRAGGTIGNHEKGLWNVPFDGYLARLHRGEQVVPSDFADEYRRAGGSGGGGVINITINAGAGTDPASLGRAVTDALRAYGRNGGGAAIRAAVNG